MKPAYRKIESRYKASFVEILFLGLTIFPSVAQAQSTGTFTATGNMIAARAGHTATLLGNGKVLIAGGGISAELYDPSSRTFIPTGNMTTSRSHQTATLLHDGKVLIAGGAGTNGITLNSAELYDPLTGSFARIGNMISARWGHTSTLLNDGRVLIAGGIADASFTSAEIYNPSAGTFAKTGDMVRPRSGHTATLLNDGRVLIAGVFDDRTGAESEDELYDPTTGNFSRNRKGIGVQQHTATLLNDGIVLFVGGSTDTAGEYSGGILYEPSSDSYFGTGVMIGPTGANSLTPHGRGDHTATLLRDGRVLIAGGTKLICGTQQGSCHLISDASTEIYDPATRTFSSSGNMTVPRAFQTATLLPDGTVLIAGGASGTPPEFGGPPTASAEIYIPFASVKGPAQPGVITTYAGPPSFFDGAEAINQAISNPTFVAPDGAGGFYMATDHRVFRVTSDGKIRAAAGTGSAGFSGDGGPATSAQLSSPGNVAVDAVGNMYIVDGFRIRKVTLDGVIHTVAGNGTSGFSGDGGPATSAQLGSPGDVAVDAVGNMYIVDGFRIRKVTLDGVIHTFAGNGTSGFSGDGGPATSAQIFFLVGVAVDAVGNLYMADFNNHRVRKVTLDGTIHTVVGSGIPGFSSGDGGPATSAQIFHLNGVAVDTVGNMYIVDGFRIRKVTLDGVIHTVAGNGTSGFSGDGGPATSAQLSSPGDVAVDAVGNMYIVDGSSIRKVTPDGLIHTVVGITSGFRGDGGPATSALFDDPLSIAMDTGGNLYIADFGNNRVRKVTPGSVISTVAGNGISGFSGDGGPATSAQLRGPYSVAVDAAGNLYIADVSNHIRKVTPDGSIRTIAGNGTSGFAGDGGPATAAAFSSGSGIAVDAGGTLYIADSGNGRIRRVTPGGTISTVYVGAVSGGIAVDAIGNLYIADYVYDSVSETLSGSIRKLAPDGTIRTIFVEEDELCCTPPTLTVDAFGNLFFSYGGSARDYVFKITSAGVLSIVAGNGQGTAEDGVLSTLARFTDIAGIAVDPGGNLLVRDAYRIRKIAFGLIVNGITPNSGGRGNVVHVSLNGANFDSTLSINPIDGITVSSLTLVSPTAATATFTIAADTVPGPRNVTVTTSTGTSNAVTFIVNPPPGLAALAPPVGVPGTTVAMGLTGTGFRDGLTVDVGSGITVSNIGVTSATSAVATLTIAPDAVLGSRNVTVTTTNGTSTPAAFNVVLPFPDLAITSTHTANFGVGFTETYNIRVRNVGLVTTTGAMTITDILPSGFAFASGGGAAWSCSAAGQAVTCVNSGVQAAGESMTLDIAVVVSSAAAPGVVHAVSVMTAGDVNPSNDSATDGTAVAPTPVPIFATNPSPIRAGSQTTLGLTLSTAFPHDVTGVLTLEFSSNAAIPLDDPAIQFASGGRQTTFVIPANALQASFEGNSLPGPVGFQAGTVAGAFSFSGTLQAGTVQTTISPSSSVASSLTIPRQAPLIQNVETTNQNGFGVVINLWSTMREVTQMNLTFSTTSEVTLNCGSVSGCSVSGPTMTLDVRSLFDAWFSSDTKFGSLTTLRLPFSVAGTVHGSVTVKLGNSMGLSMPASFSLP